MADALLGAAAWPGFAGFAGFVFIPRGRGGANMEWWVAVPLVIIVAVGIWLYVQKQKRDVKKYGPALAAEAEAEAMAREQISTMPDTGGRGVTLADLRGVTGPTPPASPSDAWLLGLAAIHVESWYLDHGRWNLAPPSPTEAWQSKIADFIEAMGAESHEEWHHWLLSEQDALTATDPEDHQQIAAQVAYLAFWIRVGCAAGHISENDARALTRNSAIRLRGICDDWLDFEELLEHAMGGEHRRTVALFTSPGWPWHENAWP